MNKQLLDRILAGSDDESDLWALYRAIETPANSYQQTFHTAWEADTLTCIGGFEKLFEQGTEFEKYGEALVDLGLPQVRQIFERVLAIVPPDLRPAERDTELFDHLHEHFDELSALADEYYEAAAASCWIAGDYIRRHREHFSAD